MAVARATGKILRTDVTQQEDLTNVPPPGAHHNYAEELGMEVQDARASLAALPRTQVALHQSATDLATV